MGGDDHNFVHIVLGNNSELQLTADSTLISPFGNYQLQSDLENQLMKELSSIVYPSFYFYQIKFPTELRFSEKKLHDDLLHFADTCSSPLVALAAINHTDFDEYFDKDKRLYEDFGQRLQRKLSHSTYTRNYLRKLHYYSHSNAPIFPSWIIIGLLVAQFLVIFGLVYWIYQLRQKLINKANEKAQNDKTQQELIGNRLTRKEREILDLMLKDRSNKEIATALFIELSTVKTHINKIYSKLQVKSRQELNELLRPQD